MAADVVTEVTGQSWFSRIGGAFKGIIVGLILVVLAGGLLFWNEGCAVKRHKTLQEGGGAVVSVSSGTVDPSMEGKLVHLSGRAETVEELRDDVFGASARAIRLTRKVEMYQWEQESSSETRKKLGGGTETVTTYSYRTVWDEAPISSSGFKEPAGHENPGSMPYRSETFTAGRVTLGAFTLSPSLVAAIGGAVPLNVTSSDDLPGHLRERALSHAGGFYLGNSLSQPAVGDLRVTFQVVHPAEVTVVARQTGDTFEAYQSRAGGTIELLERGVHTAESMFQQAEERNKSLLWILRLVGFVLMTIGFSLVLRPLSVIADVVPFIGNVVGAGTGLVSLLLGAASSLAAIAAGWITYRPLFGIALLAAAAGLVFLMRGKMKKAAPAAPPPPPRAV